MDSETGIKKKKKKKKFATVTNKRGGNAQQLRGLVYVQQA